MPTMLIWFMDGPSSLDAVGAPCTSRRVAYSSWHRGGRVHPISYENPCLFPSWWQATPPCGSWALPGEWRRRRPGKNTGLGVISPLLAGLFRLVLQFSGKLGRQLQGLGELIEPGAFHGVLLVNHRHADQVHFAGRLGRVGLTRQGLGIQRCA